jgi:histidine triad (HIT) family protein
MPTCLFCRIAAGELDAVMLYEDSEVVAFLDIAPIRPGHTQIVPRQHFATFEELPAPLAARILHLGQRLAQRLKTVYGVERVAFLFTGGDVPHAHAHVVPMHEKTDITSARYFVSPEAPEGGSAHLHADRALLLDVREALAFATEDTGEGTIAPAS